MNDYPNTPAQLWAQEHYACAKGRDELGAQTLAAWWQTSQRADYMMWVARKADAPPPKETSVKIALGCAELVEHLMPEKGKRCLALVRQWLANPDSVSKRELREAARAAVAAALRAADAAWVAVWAAEASAEKAVAEKAEEVELAARDALRAGADPEALTAIVRKHIPECPVTL